MGGGGRGDGAYGRVAGRRAEMIGDGSRDAVKGRSAKVHFVWTLAYALDYVQLNCNIFQISNQHPQYIYIQIMNFTLYI
jgi:hypothetical protein